jgi:hypothetical protein
MGWFLPVKFSGKKNGESLKAILLGFIHFEDMLKNFGRRTLYMEDYFPLDVEVSTGESFKR